MTGGAVMPSSVGVLVQQAARRFGDKTALVFEGQRWSFRELDTASSKVAAQLQQRGIGAGDKVSLFSANGPEWIVAYYAVMKLGAVANPLNLMLTPEEAAFAVNEISSLAVRSGLDGAIITQHWPQRWLLTWRKR